MSGRRCGFWAGAGALIASLLLIASMGRASLVQASSSRQATQEFKVELDPQHPGRFPEGEFVGQILGGQSFTAAFEAHASWKYDLAISQGSLQQMAVSVSGHGGPQGGFARTLPVADRSSVNVSWTAATDGTVSITVTHLIADPKTYDPTALPEFQTARIRVVGVPYDDHADDPRKATLISLGETVSGHLELGTDQDAFSFFAQPGFDYRIDATVGKVSYLGGTFWDVEDFDRVDPALAAPLRLKPTQAAGVLIHGFNARRSGLHHFVLAGAGDNVNAPYTVRVSRTPITTTVNTSGVENDGACDADHCSLPEAIDASNTREGVQTIGFNIPGMGVHRISLPGTLPDIRDSVVIDGTVQPGYSGRPVIILDGRQAGFTHGVSVGAPFNGQLKVAGLAIVNFQRAGIHLAGGSGHTIIANVVGQDPATSSPAPNLDGGIVVSGGGGHVVGAPGSGNVIVSNGAFGLSLDGLDSGGASIQGNWIGTTPDQIAAGNGGPGLRIDGAGLGLRIGGVGEGAANTFANNAGPDLIIVTRGAPVEASIQGNRFSTTAGGGKAIVADLGTTGTVKVGGTGQGEGNHFVGPFLAAVELKVDGPQPRFQLVHAGNTHMGNLVGLRISEPPRGTVDVTESANEFEGDGQAITAELRAAGTKSFGTGSATRGSGSALASFLAEPLAGARISLFISGQYESARVHVLTRGEGSVDVSLEKLTMTKTLAPHAGLQLDVGASGSVTVDGLRAEAHKVAAVVIGVGRAAGSPVKATVEIKNSVFANSANGVSTAQSALSDVSWKFSDNVYRSNGTGLEISANAAARASYEMVANRYEAQTTVGMTGSFKPLEGISVSFSSTGEFYDSNLRHAEFDIAGAGIVDIRVLDLKGTVSRGAQNESGLRYGITADVRAGMNAHVDIRRTSITGSLGAGLRAEAELPRLGTAFIEANASHFDGNRDGAVVVGWSFKFSEEPNTFSDNSGFGIVAEDSAVSITTDEITGNGNGIIVRRGGPVEVAGNTISGNSGDGLVLESIRDARVEANTITRNGGVGIVLKPDTTATLASNTFGANSGGDVVGGAPTAATAQPAESRIEIEIHSAVLRPSGDLEVVYSIDRAERIDYPLQVVFLRANVDDPSRPVEVHSETLEWADPPPGEFRAAFPNPEGRRIVAGDLLVIETRSNRGDRTRPRTVTSSDLSAQPGPSSLAADVGAMSSPTEHPTVDDQDGELPRQGRSAGERPAGGACSAPAPGTVNLEYVMLAILSGGLVGSRTRQR